jgi:hypothetical protein
MTAVAKVAEALEAHGKLVKWRGEHVQAQCPAHNDGNPSLSVSPGTKGRDVLIKCHAGCEPGAVLEAIGLTWRDLGPPKESLREVARYHYVDRAGVRLFDVVRFEPKTFRQQRADGAWGLGETPRVLYHLDEVAREVSTGGYVWVAEGEKDVDALRAHGVVATCNPMGAGKFTADHAAELRGCSLVTVVADRDDAGREHARIVAGMCHLAGVPWRTVVAGSGKDAHDHFAAGLGVADFVPLDLEPATEARRHPLAEFVIDWTEFWTAEHKTEDWLIRPLFARGRAHVLYAGAKVGKSYVTLAVVAAACCGRAILEHDGAPLTVLYVDYEMTAADLRDRLEEFGFGPGVDLSRLHYALLPSLPPLDTAEGGEALLEAARAVGADFVVIDTTGRAVQGPENEADTFRAFYRHTGGPLKQASIGWCRLDHAGKDAEKGQRGSSGKNDDVDVVWKLARTDGGVRLSATHRRISWVPEKVELLIGTGEDVTITMAAETWPKGTRECAADLDGLGVPLDVSARTATKTLHDAGYRHAREAIRAAVRYRQKEPTWVTEAVDNPAHSENDSRKVRHGAPGAPSAQSGSAHETARPRRADGAPSARPARSSGPPRRRTAPLRGGAAVGAPEVDDLAPGDDGALW